MRLWGVEVFPKALVAPGCRPFETDLVSINGVVGGQAHGVCRAAEASFRVVFFGQHVHVEVAIPLVATVAGNRHQAIPVIALRKTPCRLVANIAVGVGVDLILRGCTPAVEGADKLAKVLRSHVLDTAKVGGHARF